MSITIQFAQRGESYLGKFHQIEKNRLQLDYRFFSPGHRFELLYLVQQVMLSFTYNPGGFPGFFHGWTGSAESSGENNCRNSLKRAPLGRFSRLFGQPLHYALFRHPEIFQRVIRQLNFSDHRFGRYKFKHPAVFADPPVVAHDEERIFRHSGFSGNFFQCEIPG